MEISTIKIIGLGDSITCGYPYEPALSWFNLAQNHLHTETVNQGVNGDTTEGMLSRFQQDVIRYKPSHVIIMGGTNDAYAGVIADQVISNIRDMVELALKNRIVPIIGLPIPCNDLTAETLLEQYRQRMRHYIEKNKIDVIDFHKFMVDGSGSKIKEKMHCDGIHPNKAGHQVMADVALNMLQKCLQPAVNILSKDRIILQSERLRYRQITYDDIGELSKMLTSSMVMYAWEHTFSPRQINDWIKKQLQYYHDDGVGYFAAIAKESNEFIGQMGLHWGEINGIRVLEVCYMLQQKHWHNGYALEGTKALLQYAFSELDVNKVYACIRINNFSSIKVAKSAGMKKQGSFIKHYNGKDMEHYIYVKMRDE